MSGKYFANDLVMLYSARATEKTFFSSHPVPNWLVTSDSSVVGKTKKCFPPENYGALLACLEARMFWIICDDFICFNVLETRRWQCLRSLDNFVELTHFSENVDWIFAKWMEKDCNCCGAAFPACRAESISSDSIFGSKRVEPFIKWKKTWKNVSILNRGT